MIGAPLSSDPEQKIYYHRSRLIYTKLQQIHSTAEHRRGLDDVGPLNVDSTIRTGRLRYAARRKGVL